MFITSLYAGLLTLWFLALSARVIAARRAPGGPSLGDGGLAEVTRRIRGHANFAEYVPLVLVLMALLEHGGLRVWLVHVLGLALLVGRVLHGYALAFTEQFPFGRMAGTALTFTVMGLCALLCVAQGFGGF